MKTTVAIIGGGPAGAAAALWLHQFGIGHLLIESADRLGGLQALSPYPNEWLPGVSGKSGQQVAASLHRHITEAGCALRLHCRVTHAARHHDGYTLTLSDGTPVEARFVIIATGTVPEDGGLPPNDRISIGPAGSLLRADVRGKTIAILGGGDNAFDQVRFLTQRGIRDYTLFCRRPPRAQPKLKAIAPPEKIHIGPFHADPAAMTVDGQPFDFFSVQFGFRAVGVEGLSPAMVGGFITVNAKGETSLPGLYACGDVTNFLHPCVATAEAGGIQAARSIADRLWAA